MRSATPESLVRIVVNDSERRRRRAANPRPPLHPALLAPQRKSAVHVLSLALVWLAVFSGFLVVTEPAPVDALMVGLVVLLPVVGLTRIDTPHLVYLFLWLAIAAAELVASALAADTAAATTHTVVSIYLCVASFVVAVFIARSPAAHARLILRAYVAAALMAALLGIAGYFDIPAGAGRLFTVYDRAAGTFKDPNVYAPFLVPAMLVLGHDVLARRLPGASVAAAGLAVIGLALLLSFSRGAWVNLAVAGLAYGWIAFVTARTDRQRLKLLVVAVLALMLGVGLVVAALEIDAVSRLFDQRASLGQSYDQGPEGRFGGQERALRIILDSPLGLGPLQFGGVHHPEHPHNVYLSMLLNAGWLGGLLYIVLVAGLLMAGLRAVLRRTWASPYLLAVLAAFAGLVVEGFVVETDHWRHFYLIAGLLFGLAVEPAAAVRRTPRIAGAARRPAPALALVPATPAMARHALDLAIARARPARRTARILARAPAAAIVLVVPLRPPRRRRREPRRPARIVARH